jgi:hybrid cluster-associated redox disulfide protein
MSEATIDVPARFVPEMTVDEAMAKHEHTRWVFAAYHLSGCSQCAISSEETIAQVAAGYGVPLEKLIADLNSLLQNQDRRS